MKTIVNIKILSTATALALSAVAPQGIYAADYHGSDMRYRNSPEAQRWDAAHRVDSARQGEDASGFQSTREIRDTVNSGTDTGWHRRNNRGNGNIMDRGSSVDGNVPSNEAGGGIQSSDDVRPSNGPRMNSDIQRNDRGTVDRMNRRSSVDGNVPTSEAGGGIQSSGDIPAMLNPSVTR